MEVPDALSRAHLHTSFMDKINGLAGTGASRVNVSDMLFMLDNEI